MNLTRQSPAPKAPKLTPAEKAKGKEHMAGVKVLPCVICNAPPPSDAHHCTHRYTGLDDLNPYTIEPCAGRRSGDYDTIPLCKSCHQNGPTAIHNGKERWRKRNGPDYLYLPMVREMVEAVRDDWILGEWF